MVWLKNFLLKRKARRLVPLIAAELAKRYGAAAVYAPGQVKATAQRLKAPTSLMPMISAGFLSAEIFTSLFPGQPYQEQRNAFLGYLPKSFDGGTPNNTDEFFYLKDGPN